MLKPLVLGKQSYPVNLIQGPLAGVSCAPFRLLTWRESQPAFTCTEMISCKTLLYQAKQNSRFTALHPDEGPVCFQLSSNDPKELAEATQRITAEGASLIDLNCGCPVNKIRHKGAGSKLLSDATRLFQLISAMKKNTHLPVSIKIRVAHDHADMCNQEIAKVVSDAGADFLIVHGRHWTEHYETPCHHDEIQFFVDHLTIPVIGNGDIACITSLQKMLATGCAGVMIGRAGVGQPWLIRQLMTEMRGEWFAPPTPATIGKNFIEHIERLALLLQNDKFALLQARKLAKYYARHLPNREGFCAGINACASLENFTTTCEQFFGTV